MAEKGCREPGARAAVLGGLRTSESSGRTINATNATALVVPPEHEEVLWILHLRRWGGSFNQPHCLAREPKGAQAQRQHTMAAPETRLVREQQADDLEPLLPAVDVVPQE